MTESTLVGAWSYAAFASASCASYRAFVSGASGNVRSVSPRNEMACAPGGSVAVIGCSVERCVVPHATATAIEMNGRSRRMVEGRLSSRAEREPCHSERSEESQSSRQRDWPCLLYTSDAADE